MSNSDSITREIGFVLKRFIPRGNKVSFLSSTRGKISVSPKTRCDQLWPGMLIDCVLSKHRTFYRADDPKILLMPTSEIYWLHNMLELIYYFSPSDEPAPEIFALLYRAIEFLSYDINIELSFIKKLFVVKLLKCFGFYPSKERIPSFSFFENLVCGSVDFRNNPESLRNLQKDTMSIELDSVDKWIFTCVNRHPNVRFFKTL